MVVLIAILGACDSGKESTSALPSSTPTAPSSAHTSSAPTSPGITAEEDLAINPPAPTALRATVRDREVRLSWQPPPEVTVPHRYSDRVTGYRVYRRGPGELELRPMGTSTTLEFTDQAPGTGEFSYAVASIRDNDVEGTKSDPPAVAVVG